MHTLPDWLTSPIVGGMVVSLGLHLAALVWLEPQPSPAAPRVTVIEARLHRPAPAATVPQPLESFDGPPQEGTDPHGGPLGRVTQAGDTANPAALAAPVAAAPDMPAPEAAPAAVQPAAPATAADPAAAPAASPAPAEQASAALTLDIPFDPTWYLARQVDRHPRAQGVIAPAYPELARQRGQQGYVKIMLKIDELGRVVEAEVVEASPPGVFDASALAAFSAARFDPAMRQGRPVRYQAYMRVDFELRDAAHEPAR